MSAERYLGRWLRRAITIPLVVALWAVALATSPLVLALAALRDGVDIGARRATRRDAARTARWARTRTLAFFVLFLTCEVAGLLGAFVTWVASGVWLGGDVRRRRLVRWNAALQRRWTGALFHGALAIYGMTAEVDGGDCAASGPLILFVRHASTADTVLAAALVANPHRILLRYVLKRELLWDPCLDVVGNRLPNLFVSRGRGADSSRGREITAVAALAKALGPGDGALIFPEGTRFSPAKLERARVRLADTATPTQAALAARMRHVLPPRPGGPLALLEAAAGVDVVLMAHTGFEGARSFRELWRGGLVGHRIKVRLRRVRAADIPTDADARLDWLYERWVEVDDWIAANAAPAHRRGLADAAQADTEAAS